MSYSVLLPYSDYVSLFFHLFQYFICFMLCPADPLHPSPYPHLVSFYPIDVKCDNNEEGCSIKRLLAGGNNHDDCNNRASQHDDNENNNYDDNVNSDDK